MLTARRTKMHAPRHHGGKRVPKIWHGLKFDRMMNQKTENEKIIQMWWRGRAKKEIGCKNADSFTMQGRRPERAVSTKGTCANLPDIGYPLRAAITEIACIGKRLRQGSRSCGSIARVHGLCGRHLECGRPSRGFRVGAKFGKMCLHHPHYTKMDRRRIPLPGELNVASRRIDTKSSKTETWGQEPISWRVWQHTSLEERGRRLGHERATKVGGRSGRA